MADDWHMASFGYMWTVLLNYKNGQTITISAVLLAHTLLLAHTPPPPSLCDNNTNCWEDCTVSY